MADEFELLELDYQGRLATVTISNPPVNIITPQLYQEFLALSEHLEAKDDITVVLFKSADPDFFIAHFDVAFILSFPVDEPAARSTEPNPFHDMCQRFRTMDKITIAQVEGRVGGGGNEIISNMDMRFGVKGRTLINQMEVPLGIIPGGTGTQQLPRIVGRNRALEIMLAGEDIDAETAENWGYLNRIFEADEIGAKVGDLARRIASFPPDAVRLLKKSVNAAGDRPIDEALADEALYFQQLIRTDAARARMKQFLEIGGQTRSGEAEVDKLSRRLNDA